MYLQSAGNHPREVATSKPNLTQSQYITEYVLPTPESAPIGITVDQLGGVWVAGTNSTMLIHFNPKSKVFTEFKIPTMANGSSIWGMAVDSQGTIWFTSTDDNSVWSFNPADASFRRYPIPTPKSLPMQIAIDGEGQVWFTEVFGGRLGRIEPATGEIVEYEIPRNKSGPQALP